MALPYENATKFSPRASAVFRGGVENMTNHPNRSKQANRRMEFMDWWHYVNVDLRARGVHDQAVWGETNWRYREHVSMTPKQCADAVLADRAAA